MNRSRLIAALRILTLLMMGCSILALAVARDLALGAMSLALALFIRQNELVTRIGQLERGREAGAQPSTPAPDPGPKD
ncbi:MAG TPA: hypothetical protein VNE39_12320 [Planctomycetota bacterium]|nr:hypothetical protein [Planctomycetota bacterium]